MFKKGLKELLLEIKRRKYRMLKIAKKKKKEDFPFFRGQEHEIKNG